ncbi:hypothetical protein FHS61_000104 [Altererythrobacter atlanticus]|uniref:Uncharacterized protein n=1 Tax=Croceibacterium atlanticum TaxID=1267766 RepID=A0A0F7KRV6_9SPHN|nr:DUF3089 domain-containing protein [Croceibacterium atlanticum]AKH42334.1 hypothetical protein WYH_01289 [Croceibacterium atlanticum]MBB5731111.1 hypothetical protein [Croceibacterium atlanticum]
MARKFLYAFAFLILLVIAAMFALRLWPNQLSRIALVPTADFVEQDALAANAYQDPDMWFSRPGIAPGKDPARWQPAVAAPASEASPVADGADGEMPAEAPDFAVFFVHPTSYLERSRWNAPLDDEESQKRAWTMLRGMASPFNTASEIWAPRYRQATFGAFLTDSEEAKQAVAAAYRDVDQAFTYFLESVGPDTPIVLAGHSQGALHVLELLRKRIAGTDLQQRVAMVYPIGWPISIAHDLPALGIPACATPDQSGCIVTWSSFAEPADPSGTLELYRSTAGYDGETRGDGPIVCVDPIGGTINGSSPASRNLGTLVPDNGMTTAELVPAAVPARCDENGILLIGDPPELGPDVLPGNNYHVYDIPLFWKNLQQDVTRRVGAWTQNR